MKIMLKQKTEAISAEGRCQFLFSDTAQDHVGKAHLKEWERISANGFFAAKAKECHSFFAEGQTIIWVGLGDRTEDVDLDDVRRAVYVAYKEVVRLKLKSLTMDFFTSHLLPERLVQAVAESLTLLSYRFDAYLSKKNPCPLETVYLMLEQDGAPLKEALGRGIILGKSANEARALVNEPAGVLTPSALSEQVKRFAKNYGYEAEILQREKIEKLKMGAFLGVAQGSKEEPQLIVMRYRGGKKTDPVHGLVGKGLTYDSGGLSIKPTDSMVNMKDDMGGAAAVIGAMNALAALKAKVNVTAVVAACENMISGSSYKPGDILTTMAGKTVFVGNTDAEGRLTLFDAITYIQEQEKVADVLDIATLTGAALHALGREAALVVSNDEAAMKLLQQASFHSGEKIWRMPLFKEYEKKLKHHEADYTNIPGQPGSILAGLLIREFIVDKPWVHVDIAGPVSMDVDTDYLPKGPTGYGVRLICEYLFPAL